MQSFKQGRRSDQRFRGHKGSPNPNQSKNHNEMTQASKVGATEGAARVANLKLLLAKLNGDLVALSAAIQVNLPSLQLMLDGQKVVGSEHATHIEETLALDQGWLDQKHVEADVSAKTFDILQGKDISDFEKEIRRHEQKGLEIMKTGTSTAQTAPSSAPAASPTEKPSAEVIQTRIANLTLLTQERGAKSRLARTLGVSESIVSFLFNGKKDFTNRFSRELEGALHLPTKWLDAPHEAKDVPPKALEVLASAPASAAPSATPRVKAKPSAASTSSVKLPPLRLNLNSAPGDSSSTAKDTSPITKVQDAAVAKTASTHGKPAAPGSGETKPAAKDKAADGPSPRQPRVHQVKSAAPALSLKLNTSAPVVYEPSKNAGQRTLPLAEGSEGTTSAKDQDHSSQPTTPVAGATDAAGQAANGASASTSAAGASSAPVSTPARAPAPATSQGRLASLAEPTINKGVNSPPDTVNLAPINEALHMAHLKPITEALIKTLTQKAQEGKFSEREALRLLGEIAEL